MENGRTLREENFKKEKKRISGKNLIANGEKAFKYETGIFGAKDHFTFSTKRIFCKKEDFGP